MEQEVVKERFVITRQLNLTRRRGYEDSLTFISGEVPGRVLDLIYNEVSLHFPAVVEHDDQQVRALVRAICKRLARGEEFDMDDSLDADKRWARGMYKTIDQREA